MSIYRHLHLNASCLQVRAGCTCQNFFSILFHFQSFNLLLTCSEAMAGKLWGWFWLAETIWPFFCSSTTGCTGKGSRAARGLGSAAAVQILQPGQWCWLIEEVSTVHFNSFQLGGKLLDCSLSSKNILPHDAEF